MFNMNWNRSLQPWSVQESRCKHAKREETICYPQWFAQTTDQRNSKRSPPPPQQYVSISPHTMDISGGSSLPARWRDKPNILEKKTRSVDIPIAQISLRVETHHSNRSIVCWYHLLGLTTSTPHKSWWDGGSVWMTLERTRPKSSWSHPLYRLRNLFAPCALSKPWANPQSSFQQGGYEIP